jgi:TonB family protein
MFDEAAVAAVRRWRYRPVQRDGLPVEQRAQLRIRFTLQ